MLSLARSAFRPATSSLTRNLAARAAAVHTLPPLPYAYDVRFHRIRQPKFNTRNADSRFHLGFGAIHL